MGSPLKPVASTQSFDDAGAYDYPVVEELDPSLVCNSVHAWARGALHTCPRDAGHLIYATSDISPVSQIAGGDKGASKALARACQRDTLSAVFLASLGASQVDGFQIFYEREVPFELRSASTVDVPTEVRPSHSRQCPAARLVHSQGEASHSVLARPTLTQCCSLTRYAGGRVGGPASEDSGQGRGQPARGRAC